MGNAKTPTPNRDIQGDVISSPSASILMTVFTVYTQHSSVTLLVCRSTTSMQIAKRHIHFFPHFVQSVLENTTILLRSPHEQQGVARVCTVLCVH